MSECEEIATTINRLVEAGHITKAQELLDLSLDDYFVLQLALFADKKVNAYTTIAAWKQAGLRLPAEDTDEFYPYRDSPSVTEEQLKAEVDKLKEEMPSRLPVKTTFKNTMRWIAVLPAAVGAYFGIQIFVALGSSFGLGSESLSNVWCQLVNSIAGPYCFVYAGAKTAPTQRFITAIGLTVLFSLVNGAILVLALQNQGRLTTPLWWLITCTVIGVIATIVCCVQFHQGEDT